MFADSPGETGVITQVLLTQDSYHTPRTILAMGDRVTANFMAEGSYHGGVIQTVNADGTFYVLYDDGHFERSVSRRLIRKQGKQIHPEHGTFTPPALSDLLRTVFVVGLVYRPRAQGRDHLRGAVEGD
jgi:hypothetical protein